MWTLPDPEDLLQWKMHARLVHGVWISPSAPLAEYWEFHALDHTAPSDSCIPHRHAPPEDVAPPAWQW